MGNVHDQMKEQRMQVREQKSEIGIRKSGKQRSEFQKSEGQGGLRW